MDEHDLRADDLNHKIFISHSAKDQALIYDLASELSKKGIEVFAPRFELAPESDLRDRVFPQIDEASCVLAIFLSDGESSQWGDRELEYAHNAGKPIIPFVEKGLRPTGFLKAEEYICIDRRSRRSILDSIYSVMKYVEKLEGDEETKRNVMIAGSVFLALLLLNHERQLSEMGKDESMPYPGKR